MTPPEAATTDNAEQRQAERPEDWSYPTGLTVLFYFFVSRSIWLVSFFYFRLRIRGRQNMPKSGRTLLVCNHASHLDPPLISTASNRRIAFLAKAELFEGSFFGTMITWLGAFPIKRGGGDRAALRVAINILKKEHPLLMFPEGTRTLDGKLAEAKTGVAMLLGQVSDATIVPIRIDGSYDAWPPGVSFPRPRRITITVGKPFTINDIKDLPTDKKQLYQRLGKEIMTRIEQAAP